MKLVSQILVLFLACVTYSISAISSKRLAQGTQQRRSSDAGALSSSKASSSCEQQGGEGGAHDEVVVRCEELVT